MPVGGMSEKPGADAGQHDLEERKQREADGQHLERRKAAMHEHLVDHDLEEQRRQQPEDLQEERGDQDLGQGLAGICLIAGMNQPMPKRCATPSPDGAPRQKHQSASPGGFERFALEQFGPGASGDAAPAPWRRPTRPTTIQAPSRINASAGIGVEASRSNFDVTIRALTGTRRAARRRSVSDIVPVTPSECRICSASAGSPRIFRA